MISIRPARYCYSYASGILLYFWNHQGKRMPARAPHALRQNLFVPFTPLTLFTLTLLILVLFHPGNSSAEQYFDHYGLAAASPELDLGVQPLGYPSSVISVVMRHDRILKKALAVSKQPLKTHPFKSGTDMLALLENQRLEAAVLGDMPTIIAASTANVWIAGITKQTSVAIVAKGNTQVRDLVGQRIGYVDASTSHYTLLQGLASAGISETKVKLVPLSVSEMPGALERGEIEAFAAWEPATSTSLGNSAENHVVLRGLSATYFVIQKDFEKRSPQSALYLVAGLVRAIEWMRRSHSNTEKAARWAMAETVSFSGKPATLSVAQIAAITHREILDVPSAPAILSNPEMPTLKSEYQFLNQLGKLPPAGKWENVASALSYDGLAKVLAEPKTFQIHSYDYED